jgi:very-short-patch-repair endonuclease
MEQIIAGLVVLLVVAWPLRRFLFRLFRSSPQPKRQFPDPSDATQQLGFVSRVPFERKPLLNKGEFQVLLLLEAVVRNLRAGHRVMAQTSLGEILRPNIHASAAFDCDLAYRSINSKRADFVVVDSRGLAVLVVEFHGGGHFQGNARLRDAVKRDAFRSAGIPLIEVAANFDKADITRQVRSILAAAAPIQTLAR